MLSELRVAILQFCPKLGQVQANIARARELCSKLQPRSVDLVCFPEMAFTGYVFESSAAIRPHLEKPRTGPTSLFCSELAKRVQCYVVAGYPEALSQNELCSRTNDAGDVWQLEGANSAVVYSPAGEWVGGYRKTNLFKSDLPWAKAGTGFVTLQLPEPIGRLTLGICMDLNPHTGDWTRVDGLYELADYCLSQNTDTLLLCNAWLDSMVNDEDDTDMQTVRYWAGRLRPLWDHGDDYNGNNADTKRDITVIICNRNGTEKDTTFAGSSTLFRLTPGLGRPVALDMLTREEELLQVWNIALKNTSTAMLS
ncbi:hydrolase [Amanita rubescens]|nr:hydrolase [Amanita rubescens]